jgi:hypothetical protein
MPEKLERCVKKVKRKKGSKSARAICQSSVMGKRRARRRS